LKTLRFNQIIIAKDNGIPIGYVFSTIENVNDGDKSHIPDWAPVDDARVVKGFYPDWNDFPNKVRCLNHLFFRESYQSYRGMGIGPKLLNMAMEWLEGFPDVNVSFVYVSNGNDAALDFYIKHGFTFSHDVFGGFIKAAYKFRDR
jgi:GNAT superfamily N-acetyltransferase